MTAKYDTFQSDYDDNRRADPGITATLIDLLAPIPDGLYLDLACGTGNYTTAVSKAVSRSVPNLGVKLYGVDQSEKMLATARPKSTDVQWFQEDVEALPFEDHFFDGILCTLAIHHFSSLNKAFGEAYRVLKPGPFVLLTAWPEQMRHYWLNHYFPTALQKSVEQMPAPDLVKDALSQAGFSITKEENFFVTNDLQDLFLYSGKHRPHIYLDPNVRAGITTFWSITDRADRAEIDHGFASLKNDIESGKIDEVIGSYDDTSGDYVYLKAEKHS